MSETGGRGPSPADQPAALRLASRAIETVAALGVASYGIAALLTVADIIGRRVGAPIVGVIDLVQLFVLAGAWLVIPYAFLTGAHVGVDLLVASFGRRWAMALRAIGALIATGLLALMLYAATGAFRQQLLFGDTSQQLGIPILYYWLPLLFGIALSILAAVLSVATAPLPHRSR